jgi:YD repeat-containing protein
VVSYWSKGGAYAVNGSSYMQGVTVNGWTYFEHTLTGKNAVEVIGNGRIDELRLYPSDSQMTTYTYDPLVGMTSMTDAKGQTTTYEYDSFQRLKVIKDQNGKILKQMDYHYQNQ